MQTISLVSSTFVLFSMLPLGLYFYSREYRSGGDTEKLGTRREDDALLLNRPGMNSDSELGEGDVDKEDDALLDYNDDGDCKHADDDGGVDVDRDGFEMIAEVLPGSV